MLAKVNCVVLSVLCLCSLRNGAICHHLLIQLIMAIPHGLLQPPPVHLVIKML